MYLILYKMQALCLYIVSIKEQFIPSNVLSTHLPLICQSYAVDENVDPCHIWVDVNLLPAEIRIFVRNTGSHFEEGILEKLDHSKKESHGFGIGLHNIQQRIKLTYGPEYGLTVYNQEEMAVVEIRLPRKPYTGGNENVEMHDRR